LLKKIIVLPHIDIFFDSFFLDKKVNYGKVDKFLNPLKQKSFGFIFMASQIHYLHTNVFNYFQNFISFKATDARDISVLKNQLKLDQEYGKGYYSNKRKASYQIDYLMDLKPNVVLMKRSNLPQTFPVKLNAIDVILLVWLSLFSLIEIFLRVCRIWRASSWSGASPGTF